jgi:energy-coupling factor transporter ATP-binding protein EcfA2
MNSDLNELPAADKADKTPSPVSPRPNRVETLLRDLLTRVTTFTDQDGVPFMSVPVAGRTAHLELHSQECLDYLDQASYAKSRRVLTEPEKEQICGALAGRARFESSSFPIYVRVAPLPNGDLCLDLGAADGRAVIVTEVGWQVVLNAPVRFRRPSKMLPLPSPEPGGTIDDLRPFLRGTDDQFMVLVAFLLAAFRPQVPHPILELIGEQGCGKSTVATVLQRLTDPSSITRRSQPKAERDLAVAVRGGHLLVFDNCAPLSSEMSDVFCRLSTGGTFTTRTLYSDTAETALRLGQPCILNGIETIATRPDLLDRCWSVEFPRLPTEQRRAEVSFWADFEAALPRLLGVLLDGLVYALRERDRLAIQPTQRLIDVEQWVCAGVTAFGWNPVSLQRALQRQQMTSHARALEACGPLWDGLKQLKKPWIGTVQELMTATGQTGSHREFGNTLRRYMPNFLAFGICVDRWRQGHAGTRGYRVTEVGSAVSVVSGDD